MTHVEQEVVTLPEHLAPPWLLLEFMYCSHSCVYRFCILPLVVLLDHDIGIILGFIVPYDVSTTMMADV